MKPSLEHHGPEEWLKLARLRALAKEGFDQLDQRQGITLNGARELARHIETLGKRAATVKARRR